MFKKKEISLFKFQQIDEYMSRKDLDEQEKLFFTVCVVYDFTEYELDKMDIRKVWKLINKVNKVFEKELHPKPMDQIGAYEPNYDPNTYTLGQFISLSAYTQAYVKHAHRILGVITGDAETTFERADYFLEQPMDKTVGSIKFFLGNFKQFLSKYKSLFGLGDESEVSDGHPFQKNWGWIYSATKVAEHNRVTLEEAMQLNVRQAFGDLAYLKAKDSFDAEQIKKK